MLNSIFYVKSGHEFDKTILVEIFEQDELGKGPFKDEIIHDFVELSL